MRVLFAQPHPRDITLGSPKSVLRLGDALAALGHEVHHLFLTDLPVRLREHRSLYLTFPLVILARALKCKYDIVDVASGDGFLAAAMQRILRRKLPTLVVRVLGMEHLLWKEFELSHERGEEHINRRHRLVFGGMRLAEVEASIRQSRHVLCLCNQDKAHIVAHGWRTEAAVSVVPPGADQIYLDAPLADLASASILFVGTWQSRKGIPDLATAFPQVLARVPAARLVVAGAHVPASSVLETFPQPAREAVRVVPPSSERDLLALMQASAVFAFPSRYEGFGLAFLEAMAAGLPVVGTATGGMADLIESGVNGVIVPQRDPASLAAALTALLEDREQRRKLGRAAHATAQTYTWKRAARSTDEVYRRAVR